MRVQLYSEQQRCSVVSEFVHFYKQELKGGRERGKKKGQTRSKKKTDKTHTER